MRHHSDSSPPPSPAESDSPEDTEDRTPLSVLTAPAAGNPTGREAPAGERPRPGAGEDRERTRLPLLCSLLTVLLVVSVVCGVALGPTSVPLGKTVELLWQALRGGVIPAEDAGVYYIIWDVRLPRVLLAAVVGAGLSAVGVATQAMVRNALADPFVLGISSGASVGASAVALYGVLGALGLYALSTAAFLGALVATVLVYLIARTAEGLTPLRLILTGTAMSYGFSAVTTLLVFQSPNGNAAKATMFWLLGSLGGVTWNSLPVATVVLACGLCYLLLSAERLNALAMGDETATTLGVDPGRFRRELFVLAAAVTGVLVAISGAVGFVGLMLPHLARLMVGADHRRVLLLAPLAGAVFLVWTDLLARTVAAPEQLPLGVITAAIGVPCFLLLMHRRKATLGGR
ncbi:FecCD family ABC transporter permease [Actinopolyspora mortivallis]|uniref:Sugar ABC transporter substrate-binding protein n=1 Tax=Actinopolyspora mortivallis TaxID=33906 RepID=A0A2T0GUZ6_ACTMO|nr:iron ABC transporter permease [Actinopolyspora mortivallis]PRW62920.1 sugar ABC transporter substrate-binding protein [Actinopolyspora mortivallis]